MMPSPVLLHHSCARCLLLLTMQLEMAPEAEIRDHQIPVHVRHLHRSVHAFQLSALVKSAWYTTVAHTHATHARRGNVRCADPGPAATAGHWQASHRRPACQLAAAATDSYGPRSGASLCILQLGCQPLLKPMPTTWQLDCCALSHLRPPQRAPQR
jgi:hypothetical protein